MGTTEQKQCKCNSFFNNVAQDLNERFKLALDTTHSEAAATFYQQQYDNTVYIFEKVGLKITRDKNTGLHSVEFREDIAEAAKTNVF